MVFHSLYRLSTVKADMHVITVDASGYATVQFPNVDVHQRCRKVTNASHWLPGFAHPIYSTLSSICVSSVLCVWQQRRTTVCVVTTLHSNFPQHRWSGFSACIWEQQISGLSYHLSSSSSASSCNRCFQRNRVIMSNLQHRSTSCLWAPVLREGRRSHYSYNEIIMNGAPRPHHRNIYCIIYSASPLVQGERTHINFQPRSSPPHSSSCLLLKAEVPARSLSFFHSFFFSFFFFVVFSSEMRHREHPSGPWGLNTVRPASCGRSTLALIFIFLFALVFLCFFLFCCFFSYNWSNSILPKDYKQELAGICGMHSQFS